MTTLRAIIHNITDFGVRDFMDNPTARYITITNTIALIAALFGILIVAVLLAGFGFARYVRLVTMLFFIGALLVIPLMNQLGYYNLSRLLLSWYFPAFAILVSVLSKLYEPEEVSINDYFDFRIVMLVGAVLPLIVFDSRKPGLILAGLLPGILLVALFDPIHMLFDVPFSSRYEDPTYFMTTALTVITYLGILAFIGGLKRLSDRSERKINLQNQLLVKKNVELNTINELVERQKLEIVEQNEQLREANKTIEQQKTYLRHQNEQLQEQVKQKTISLSNANRELTLHNNELREFSHMLSHNLKGPVSSLKGLTQLIDQEKLSGTNAEVYDHIARTIRSMDDVFHDLGKIIELRQDIYSARDMIDISTEIDHIRNLLQQDITSNNVKIYLHKSIEKPLYSNRIKLQSILFNLINNAIKYRHEQRDPEINITVGKLHDHFQIRVRDNGLGIDLTRYREKVFHLYARFHDHVDGKGMGLYLVKQQVESLGGTIEVRSQIDAYTEFIINIPDRVEGQEVH